MAEAGLTVIRVGESVWSTWEPEDGRFELEWLAPVLDGAHARGITVILGTPTYAMPPWLVRKYPELTAERGTGERIPYGHRQDADYSHAAFRWHADRIAHQVVGRYAQHPAVIGYQVDNEPGMELFHNRGAFQGFVDTLRAVRRRRHAQPRVGPRLLVASHRPLGRAVDAGRQHRPVLRPRLAPLPVADHDRLHRGAGRHRARARAPRPVRDDVHGAEPARRSTRVSSTAQPRRRRGQPVLPDAGRADDARGAGGRPAALAWTRHAGAWAIHFQGDLTYAALRRAVPGDRDERAVDR